MPMFSELLGKILSKLVDSGFKCRQNIASCFLVPSIGGRWYIMTQVAVYTTYIPLIYCQLGWLYLTYHLFREAGKSIVNIAGFIHDSPTFLRLTSPPEKLAFFRSEKEGNHPSNYDISLQSYQNSIFISSDFLMIFVFKIYPLQVNC